jgi:hypothetical protein
MKVVDILFDGFDVDYIKRILNIKSDELQRAFFAYYVCELAGGLELPTKSHKTKLFKILIKKGISYNELFEKIDNKRAFERLINGTK